MSIKSRCFDFSTKQMFSTSTSQTHLCLFCLTFSPGVRLGRGLQAADGAGAGSQTLPRLSRKRGLPGHHGNLLPPSRVQPLTEPDVALHRQRRQPQLPRTRALGGHSQPDPELHRSEWEKHGVPVPAGWGSQDYHARGPRQTSVFPWSNSAGTATKAPTNTSHRMSRLNKTCCSRYLLGRPLLSNVDGAEM